MPTSVPRIQVTPSCQSHSDLLNYWASIEGRSVSSLCSTLLEEAVVTALKEGRANSMAVEMMNEIMDLRKRGLDHKFGSEMVDYSQDIGVSEAELISDNPEYSDEISQAFQVAKYYWDNKDKDQDDDYKKQKRIKDDLKELIAEGVRFMEFDDKLTSQRAELFLIKYLASSWSSPSISKFLTLVEQLNEVKGDDDKKLKYLKESMYVWEEYFMDKCSPPPSTSIKELKDWATMHGIEEPF